MTEETVLKPRKKVYCEVCSVFVSSESLLAIHNNGKKHQRLLKARVERQVCAERSIYAQGFCNTKSLENDLHDYFSKFGNVSSVFVDKEKAKYAIVEFQSATEAKAILDSKERPLFHGKHLKIKQRCLKEPPTTKPQARPRNRGKTPGDTGNVNQFLDEDVIDRMKRANTLDDQVKILVSATCLSDEDNQLRDLIVQYLHEMFVEAFPECEVVPFGSSTTGLGLKGSDLDLCLFADPASLKQLECGEDSSSSCNVSDQLEFIVQLLKQFAAGFQNVVAVVSAKCPLVKFIHRDSGLSCDLSINNRLATRNTELIKAYVTLDDRIRLLAITLKNWGGAKCLTGSGGRQISNYSMVLMLLHFLQRTRPPVIPVLQKTHEDNNVTMSTDTTNKTVIDGWDCSFMSTMKKGESANNESFGDLLKGWFYYYGHVFDYGNEVIVIQNEETERVVKIDIAKSILKASYGEPNMHFKLSPLCVQDPLELSHNLTQSVSVDDLRCFIQSCMHAHSSLTKGIDVANFAGSSTSNTKANKDEAFVELFAVSAKSRKEVYSFVIPLLSSVTKRTKSEEVLDKFERTCEFITETLIRELQVSACEPTDGCIHDAGAGTVKISRDTSFDCLENNASCVAHEDVYISSSKRAREDDDWTETGVVKKVKYSNRKEKNSFFLVCKAAHVTWQNRRRQRRVRKQSECSGVKEFRSSNTVANQEKHLVDETVEHDTKFRDAGLNPTAPVESPVRSNETTSFEQTTCADKLQSLECGQNQVDEKPSQVDENQVDEMLQNEKNIKEIELTQTFLQLNPSNEDISCERTTCVEGYRSPRSDLANTATNNENGNKVDEMAQYVNEMRKNGYTKKNQRKTSDESNENVTCERTTDISHSRSSAESDLAFTSANFQWTSEPCGIVQNEQNTKETGLNQALLQSSPDESRGNVPCERTTPASLGNAKHTSVKNDQPSVEFTLKIELSNNGQVGPNINECIVILSYLNGSIHHFANFYAFFKKFIGRKIAEHTQN